MPSTAIARRGSEDHLDWLFAAPSEVQNPPPLPDETAERIALPKPERITPPSDVEPLIEEANKLHLMGADDPSHRYYNRLCDVVDLIEAYGLQRI